MYAILNPYTDQFEDSLFFGAGVVKTIKGICELHLSIFEHAAQLVFVN